MSDIVMGIILALIIVFLVFVDLHIETGFTAPLRRKLSWKNADLSRPVHIYYFAYVKGLYGAVVNMNSVYTLGYLISIYPGLKGWVRFVPGSDDLSLIINRDPAELGTSLVSQDLCNSLTFAKVEKNWKVVTSEHALSDLKTLSKTVSDLNASGFACAIEGTRVLVELLEDFPL